MNKEKLEQINNRLKEMIKSDQEKTNSISMDTLKASQSTSSTTTSPQKTHVIRRRKGSPDKKIFE